MGTATPTSASSAAISAPAVAVDGRAAGPQAQQDAHPRRRLIFAIVSIALFMSSVDQTIVATALPSIQRELHAQINWTGWTITIYALGQVLAMPMAGKLSDQYGRKKVFVLAVVLFTTASLCCGFANDIYVLVALRAVQAIGGGAFMPAATGIVSDQFGKDRDRALGMFASIFPIGGIVGPIMGGLFVAEWSWRGIFLINVPIGVVLLVLAVKYVPHTAPKSSARLDVRGVALLGILILSAMLGISYLGIGGASLFSPFFLVPEAVAVASIWLFARHAVRATNPFIPIGLLRGRGFAVMNLINLLYGAAAMGFGALVPLYAEERYGIHSLAAGTLLTARAVGMICVAALAVMALRRTGYRLPMISGFLVVAVGLVLMCLSPQGMSAYHWLAVTAAITGVGMGFSVPASNNAILQLAPEHVAAIAGLRGMFRQSGAIMAVSITTAILAQSSNPGLAQAHIFLVYAVILVAVVPLILLVPEHHGSW